MYKYDILFILNMYSYFVWPITLIIIATLKYFLKKNKKIQRPNQEIEKLKNKQYPQNYQLIYKFAALIYVMIIGTVGIFLGLYISMFTIGLNSWNSAISISESIYTLNNFIIGILLTHMFSSIIITPLIPKQFYSFMQLEDIKRG